MASSDLAVPLSLTDVTSVTLTNGSRSVTMTFDQTAVEWKEEGEKFVEARTRDKHESTPITRKTGDGNCTFSAKFLVTGFRGSTAATPYEILTFTGLCASDTTIGVGDRKQIRVAMPFSASGAGGVTQTATFNYCVVSNVSVSPTGADGLFLCSFDAVDHENRPTLA